MSEESKSIWKKSFRGRMALIIWLAVAVFIFMLGSFIVVLLNYNQPMSDSLWTMAILGGIFLVVCLGLIYVVWPLLRWLFWKHWRRSFFGLACFATLIALFYVEEDWRGKHDWEKFKREWEAKGEKFDFKDFVPPPVPDDQNFAMAPIWIESIKATLGPKNSLKWFGSYAENGRTNFTDPLQMSIVDSDDAKISQTNINWGSWAKGTLTVLSGWQSYYRRLAATTNEFPVAPQPQTPAQDVLLALSKFDPAIEELREASQLPFSRFPLNYDTENPGVILLPHLAALKRSSQVLQLRALAELQNGESEKALDDVKLMLRLTDASRTEPFLISHLVRIAMTEIIIQPIYEGLANHQWTDAQLVALDAELAKLDFLADYQLSLRGERAMNGAVIDYIGKEKRFQRYREMIGVTEDDDEGVTTPGQLEYTAKAIGVYLMPIGWFDQNKLFIAQAQQGWISGFVFPESQMVLPQKIREVDQSHSAIFNRPSRPWNFLAKGLLPALGGAGRKAAREQISVDLARTAIALERCRLANGNYPESLDALAPKFISEVPHDVIDGQPLHYRRTNDGQFVLYSVGWNETDDGGVPGYKKDITVPYFELGDWVWRYPQK
jgi:hypothetical protein